MLSEMYLIVRSDKSSLQLTRELVKGNERFHIKDSATGTELWNSNIFPVLQAVAKWLYFHHPYRVEMLVPCSPFRINERLDSIIYDNTVIKYNPYEL